jgi:type VI protein secretion system component VasA
LETILPSGISRKAQGTRRKVEDAWHDIEQKMISCLEPYALRPAPCASIMLLEVKYGY